MTWRRRIQLTVEAGYRGAAVGLFTWDESNWDELTWSGVEPVFVALEGATIEKLTTTRGREAGLKRHAAGTAELILAWASPTGNWSFRPSSPIGLGQEIRVTAQVDHGPLIPIYRGAVRSVADDWKPNGPFRIRVRLVDRLAELGAVDLPEGAAAGLGDMTGERLDRIADLAEINAYYRRFDAGQVEHQSSNFARNLLDEAMVSVESEIGDLFADREGFLRFREQFWYNVEARATAAQQTWTNVPATPASVSPTDFDTESSLDDVVNRVSMARAGGTAITVSDAGSIASYGLRTYQRFDLTCRFDADVLAAADNRLLQLAQRTRKLTPLNSELNPRASAADITRLIDVEIGDYHRVLWNDGEPEPFDRAFHVQGVSHAIDASSWRVQCRLWAYADYAPTGNWGEATWGDVTWGT